MVVRRVAIKEEVKKCYVLIKKDTSKMKNTLLQSILQNILKNQTFQRIAKFSVVDSHEMDFMKGIVTLAKVDEMYNSLQKYKSLLVTVYLPRGKDGIR